MKTIISTEILRELVMIFIVNLSVLTTGMSLGWPSPMLVKLGDAAQTHLARPITMDEGSWIVSLGFFVCIFCNIPTGYLLDRIGRKYSLILASMPKLLGCLLVLYGNEVWMILLGRTFMLLSDGTLLVIVPVYASEIARKEYRGAFGTFLQIFSSAGMVITFSVGPFVGYHTFNTILLGMIIASSVPILFFPDSPYYECSKGNITKAIKSLTIIRGSEVTAKAEIEEYLNEKNETKIDKMALLRNRLFWKSLVLASIISSGSQLLGYNAVSYYMQTILISSNTNVRSEIGSLVIGIIQLVASLCSVAITEKLGRRAILIGSLFGILLGLIGLGVFFQASERPGFVAKGFMNYLPTASLVLIVYCFSAGIGSTLWVITAELFDGPARACGVSMSLTLLMSIMSVFTKYFPLLTVTIGAANTYWLFSANCTIILVLIFLFVPETKGKSFGEIQKILMERTFHVRQLKDKAKLDEA